MGYNQPIQSNPQEQFVQIPLHIEHSPTTKTNQTSDSNSNQRCNKWLTIIICIIFIGIGQSIVRILENYYYLHTNVRLYNRIWTQSLLQVVGFPLLILPFFLFLLLSSKKQIQLLMTANGTSHIQLAIIGIFMVFQSCFSTSKHEIPFRVFTLIYTTQLLFTPFYSIFFCNVKLNRWMSISLIFAILTGVFTLYTFSAGSPVYNGKKYYNPGTWLALCAALFFSLLLCQIRSIFEELISICKESTNRKQPSFAAVLELLIFSSLSATVFFVAAVFISGNHHDLKREMDAFSKGEIAYVRTLVGQAVAWQIYWVGIVGLVFAVSAAFSNVVSVCTWPIVSLLVAVFYNKYDEYDVFRGTAFVTAVFSVASYFYLIHKEKIDRDDARS